MGNMTFGTTIFIIYTPPSILYEREFKQGNQNDYQYNNFRAQVSRRFWSSKQFLYKTDTIESPLLARISTSWSKWVLIWQSWARVSRQSQTENFDLGIDVFWKNRHHRAPFIGTYPVEMTSTTLFSTRILRWSETVDFDLFFGNIW